MGLKKITGLIAFFFITTTVFSAISFPNKEDWQFLSVDGKQIPVVYRASLKDAKGALIIIQGEQERRFETSIVNFLRTSFPSTGWSTLGINIPNKEKQSSVFLSPEKQLSQAVLMLKNSGEKVIYVLLSGEDAGSFLGHFIKENIRNINGIILLSSYSKERNH